MSNHETERGTTDAEKGLQSGATRATARSEAVSVDRIEDWMLDTIEDWEQDANTAVLRAQRALNYTGGGSLTPARLGINIGSVLLSSLSPWASAIATMVTATLPTPTGLNFIAIQAELETAVEEMASSLAIQARDRAEALHALSQTVHVDWDEDELRTQALTSVVSSEFIRSRGSRPSVNHSHLQASLELGMLLDVAAMDIRAEGGFGGSYPLIIFVIEYVFDPKTTLEDGHVTAFYRWKWRYRFKIQTYGLKNYKRRLKVLLTRLNRRLDPGTRSIRLAIKFDIANIGHFEYLGHTQPPVRVEEADWESDEIRNEAHALTALSSIPWNVHPDTRDEQFCYAVIGEAVWQTSLLPPIPYP